MVHCGKCSRNDTAALAEQGYTITHYLVPATNPAIHISMPTPTTSPAMSSSSIPPILTYDNTFVIIERACGGRCGRAKESKAGGCMGFCPIFRIQAKVNHS